MPSSTNIPAQGLELCYLRPAMCINSGKAKNNHPVHFFGVLFIKVKPAYLSTFQREAVGGYGPKVESQGGARRASPKKKTPAASDHP